jgi:hypothetical protein
MQQAHLQQTCAHSHCCCCWLLLAAAHHCHNTLLLLLLLLLLLRYPVDKQTYNAAARGGSLRMVQWLYRVAPDAVPASIALDAAYSGSVQLAAWLYDQALGRWDQESLSHM